MGPFTTAVPDSTLTGFMSMQVISQDHYTTEVAYGPGAFTYTKDNVGTRYVYIIIRTLADPEKTEDIKAANAVQDAIKVEQASVGKFEVPDWDQISQGKAREALSALGALGGTVNRFGKKQEVDPFDHLIGTAIGWGGNPRNATDYQSFYPTKNDGTTVHRLTVKDIPVDGFWSVSVYDAKGFFEKNPLDAYSLNNLTARPSADGSVTVQFGGCGRTRQTACRSCRLELRGTALSAPQGNPRRDLEAARGAAGHLTADLRHLLAGGMTRRVLRGRFQSLKIHHHVIAFDRDLDGLGDIRPLHHSRARLNIDRIGFHAKTAPIAVGLAGADVELPAMPGAADDLP
jgi:hypothetical protein